MRHVRRIPFATKVGFVVVALATSSVASAQWYVGGSVGQSSTSFNTADYTLGVAAISESQDKTKTAYKLFGGYDFTKNWAIEGGYANLGKPQYNYSGVFSGYANVKKSSWFVDAKGTLPISDQSNLFGKLGFTRNKSELYATSSNAAFNALVGFPMSKSKSRNDVHFGVGGEYVATKNIGVRLEYEDFGKFGDRNNGTGRTKTNLWSLGADYKF